MKRYIYVLIFFISSTMSFSQIKRVELSHYIFPEFIKGVVLMKNGIKNETLLNYNTLTQEMIFQERGKKLAIGKEEQELVDTVFIRDRKFFVLNKKFFELIYHSKADLYAEHISNVIPPGQPAAYGGTSYTSATTSFTSINSGGMVYELQLPDGFVVKPHTYYWLKRNGELKKFFNIKQLIKLFEDKKDFCKAYIKENDVDYDNQESMVQFIKYLESQQ